MAKKNKTQKSILLKENINDLSLAHDMSAVVAHDMSAFQQREVGRQVEWEDEGLL